MDRSSCVAADTTKQLEIDGQIDGLQARIRSLKTERNAYAHISRLPDEILFEIFLTAKWSSVSARSFSKLYRRELECSGERNWLNVASVCTYWRGLTLDCPPLWSTMDLVPVDRALEMIKRSKSVPLTIKCPNIAEEGHDMDEVARVVMSNIHRIQSLDIGARKGEQLFKFLRLNQGESATMLRSLTLRVPMFSLPKDILERDMSSLQELNLFDGTLTHPFPPLPRLKWLIIDPMEFVMTSHLFMDVLLEALQNAPNLEVLRVYKVIAPSDDSLDHTFPLIHLPHLTNLSVSGQTAFSSKLFQFIKYPQTASVAFECQSIYPNSDLTHLRNALNHFTSLPGRIIRDIGVDTRDGFEIALDTVHRSSTNTFKLTLPEGLIEFPDKVTELLSIVPFTKTPSLHLTGMNEDTIQPSLLFGPCKEIKVLSLTACTVEVFRSMKKANHSDLPLPKLRKLTVEQCAFNISYEERDPEMCKALTTFLKQRKQMKAELKELIIEDCDITMSVVDEFRKFTTVDWDYREIDSEKEEEEEDHDDEEDWSDGEGAYIF